MEDNICIDCGLEMNLVIIKKARPPITRRIARYECDCGFKISTESNSEEINRMQYELEDKKRNEGVDYDDCSIVDID